MTVLFSSVPACLTRVRSMSGFILVVYRIVSYLLLISDYGRTLLLGLPVKCDEKAPRQFLNLVGQANDRSLDQAYLVVYVVKSAIILHTRCARSLSPPFLVSKYS